MVSASSLGVLLVFLTSLGAPVQDRERTVLQVNKPRDAAVSSRVPAQAPTPEALLAAARVFHISSTAARFDVAKLESQVIEQKKFQQFGLSLTRDPDQADAIIEVTASESGHTLTYAVIDARTKTIIGGGKEHAIFGLAPKQVARDLVGKIDRARRRR